MRKTNFSFYQRTKQFVYEQMARNYREQESVKKVPWTPFEEKLLESKIALITVSGAYDKESEAFTKKEKNSDYEYQEIDIKTDPANIDFLPLDWNTSEAKKDINVILPSEHLILLHKEGIIGEIDDKIYSFAGYFEKKLYLQKSIETLAETLKKNNNHGALIIPVSPITAEAACHIANGIEKLGVSTVLISPFYEQALVHTPPRCAFINFPFGRIFGPANKITLQTAILRDLLRLFEKSKIPGEILNMNFIWSFGDILDK